jgi:hypothetical protein
MLATHFPKQAHSVEEALLCLDIMSRRSRYLGLDAPTQSRTAYEPTADQTGYNTSRLTVDELHVLHSLLCKMADPPTTEQPAIEHKPNGGITIALSPP